MTLRRYCCNVMQWERHNEWIDHSPRTGAYAGRSLAREDVKARCSFVGERHSASDPELMGADPMMANVHLEVRSNYTDLPSSWLAAAASTLSGTLGMYCKKPFQE